MLKLEKTELECINGGAVCERRLRSQRRRLSRTRRRLRRDRRALRICERRNGESSSSSLIF